MNKDSDHRHRRSIRLPGYDYSQTGAYFITICADNREHLFGKIVNCEMILNELGMIVRAEWVRTAELRDYVVLGEWIIMPNHFHCIIIIRRGAARRAPTAPFAQLNEITTAPFAQLNDPTNTPIAQLHDPTTTPIAQLNNPTTAPIAQLHNPTNAPVEQTHKSVNHDHALALEEGAARRAPTAPFLQKDYPTNTSAEQFGKPTVGSIPTIVRSFKSAVTKAVNERRDTPGAPVWQRNYYEHIIRDDEDYVRIAEYIVNNPSGWENDKLFSGSENDLLRI